MTAAIAIDSRFSEVRVGIQPTGGSDVALCVLGPKTDPFEWFREREGDNPSLVVIAGGSYSPCAPGTYKLDARLAEDAARIDSWHPRNRMTVRAFEYCDGTGVPGVVVDPMSSASTQPELRLSGHPRYERRGVYYAFPQRTAYLWAVRSLGLNPDEAAVITAYLGDETAVTAHLGGQVIATSDPVSCEGPFGFTSAGTVPATSFVSWLRENPAEEAETLEMLKTRSGAFAYAGVKVMAEYVKRLSQRDPGALEGIRGMAYQVSKEIGREMAAHRGQTQAIALTGPGASLDLLTAAIEERVSKWCKVIRVPEDACMESLLREGLGALAAKNFLRYP